MIAVFFMNLGNVRKEIVQNVDCLRQRTTVHWLHAIPNVVIQNVEKQVTLKKSVQNQNALIALDTLASLVVFVVQSARSPAFAHMPNVILILVNVDQEEEGAPTACKSIQDQRGWQIPCREV